MPEPRPTATDRPPAVVSLAATAVISDTWCLGPNIFVVRSAAPGRPEGSAALLPVSVPGTLAEACCREELVACCVGISKSLRVEEEKPGSSAPTVSSRRRCCGVCACGHMPWHRLQAAVRETQGWLHEPNISMSCTSVWFESTKCKLHHSLMLRRDGAKIYQGFSISWSVLTSSHITSNTL